MIIIILVIILLSRFYFHVRHNAFQNSCLPVKTNGMELKEMPYIIDYNVTVEGELVNATGMMVDILDLMAKKFVFR